MGPPPFGGGNQRGGAKTSRAERCFNGATAFRRRKHRILGYDRRSRGRFNGATAFRRRKPAKRVRDAIKTIWLQWGHRLSAAETITPPGGRHLTSRASMGPPPFGGGNVLPISTSSSRSIELQWGHRLSAAETPLKAMKVWEAKSLQWGHRLSAAETRSNSGS